MVMEEISLNELRQAYEPKTDYIRLQDGTSYVIELGKNEQAIKKDIRIRNHHQSPTRRYPQEEVPYPISAKDKEWQTRDDIYSLLKKLISGEKTISQIRETIKHDQKLGKYIKEKVPFRNIYNNPDLVKEIAFPSNTFTEYLRKQTVIQYKTIPELKNIENKLIDSADELCSGEDTKEIASALLYDDILRKTLAGDFPELERSKKKDRISELSTISRLSEGQIKYRAKKIKAKHIEEILEYKRKNNLLTYKDLQRYDKIKQTNMIQEIKDRVHDRRNSRQNKDSYAAIARAYGLKDGKVVSRVADKRYSKMYFYHDDDSMESLEKIYRATA